MNKVININLSNRLLAIDEEAYQQLMGYLQWLKQYFAREKGGEEIYKDMEDRIAELFEDKIRRQSPSISIDDVRSVIAIMGSPEQLAQETAEELAEENAQQGGAGSRSQIAAQPPHDASKLYRLRNDKIVGGVCAGLAQYFKADVSIIRILMILVMFYYGSGILLYAILWAILPVSNEPITHLKKRLYRATDGKIIAGVAKGLGAYLNIPVGWMRFLFLAPLAGSIFFEILNDKELSSLFQGLLPTLTVLYFVLWAILPNAKTITEKMELRGEKLDVQNLTSALQQEQKSTRKPTEGNPSFMRTVLKVLGYISIFFVLLIALLVVGALLAGFSAAALGLGGFGAYSLPFAKLIFEQDWQRNLFYMSAVAALALPFIALVRWFYVLARRPRRSNHWVTGGIGLLWLGGLFGLFYSVGNLVSDFKHDFKTKETLSLQQPTDTLLLAALRQSNSSETAFDFIQKDADGRYLLSNVGLKVVPSEDSLFHLQLIRQSNGKSKEEAKALLSQIPFSYEQKGNQLLLPQFLPLGNGKQLFRGQLLIAELQVPKGKVLRTGDLPKSFSQSWHIQSFKKGINVKVGQGMNWSSNATYRMTEAGSLERL